MIGRCRPLAVISLATYYITLTEMLYRFYDSYSTYFIIQIILYLLQLSKEYYKNFKKYSEVDNTFFFSEGIP